MFRNIGIRGRLLISFFGISMFSVLAAGAALYSFIEVGKVLDRVSNIEVPDAIVSLEISRQAERMVGAAPLMLSATNIGQRDQIRNQITKESKRLDQLMVRLRKGRDGDKILETIEWSVPQIRANLEKLHELVGHRILLNESRRDALNEFREFHAVMQRHLSSSISELDLKIEQARAINRESFRGANASSVVGPQLLNLMESRESLRAAQAHLSTIHGILLEIQLAEQPEVISDLSVRGQVALGMLKSLMDHFVPTSADSMAPQISKLQFTLEGTNEIFTQLTEEIAAAAKARGVLIDISWLSEEMSAAIDQLVDGAKNKITSAVAQATSAQRISTRAILAIVVLSLICSVLIVWLYVGRNLIARLTAMSGGMLAIAGGQLDTSIPAAGSDEIGDMAKALAVFRNTAIEVKETNLHEIREARLRLVDAIESISEGFSLFDSEDRLVVSNTRYRELFSPDAEDVAEQGTPFETIIRKAAEKGYIEGAKGRIDEWLSERLAQHRDPGGPQLQRRADGRWIQISERRTEDGGTVAVYTDVTELRRAEEALRESERRLREAAQSAEAARERAETALAELKATQQNLIHAEKMAALGELTAGIAHEIKNPLNFINNFAEISSELLGELKEEIEPAVTTLKEDDQEEVEALISTLSGNLGKIHEHGQRADSIVKGMLLHSRGGTDQHALTDVNFLAEEALNLSYHGARAQDQEFNVTLERDLDPEVGSIEIVPQEITRVLFNLLANGFYATRKRRQATQDGAYEPTVGLATRDLGDDIEIRVRDNGTGMSPDVIDKLFTPFFTTKPPGEGTGLGLSLSYEIVVQRHNGQFTVDSKEGQYSEFIITLPRRQSGVAAAPAEGGNT